MEKAFTIIVTYNGASWIVKCISSLLNSTAKTSIIIIDNASTDDTVQLIQPFFNQLTLIRNTENKGFGQANNQGMEIAIRENADYCFLLNQDVYVFKNTISLLLAALKERPEYGIISPLQLNAGGTDIDNNLKNYIRKKYSEESLSSMLNENETAGDQKIYPMRFINAASWMISKKCLQQTGLFHPVFYHYGEDNHYASRVQFHGYRLGLLPASKVIHDRNTNPGNDKNILIRKIKTIPLYTLLDIRKPFPLAYLLGFMKFKSLAKKLKAFADEETYLIAAQQRFWFTKKFKEAKQIRTKSKKRALLNLQQ